ncbi:MAG: hypothetical protein EXX96DRAFT_476630 [Benjaminiella poitrasii]|nr:MAG: hypothetical protein EXX96DRAFT_476630 [Benjaminiella poitrasii]
MSLSITSTVASTCQWQSTLGNRRLWKTFWSTPFPHKTFTLWHRLLHNSVGYQAKLFRWNSQIWLSALCPICRSASEDSSHFFVSCHYKWPFWQAALALVG